VVDVSQTIQFNARMIVKSIGSLVQSLLCGGVGDAMCGGEKLQKNHGVIFVYFHLKNPVFSQPKSDPPHRGAACSLPERSLMMK
jgi:hypothetical protein